MKKLTDEIDFRKLDFYIRSLVKVTTETKNTSLIWLSNKKVLDFIVKVKEFIIETEGKTKEEMFPFAYSEHVFQPQFDDKVLGKLYRSDQRIPSIVFWEDFNICQTKFPNTPILIYRKTELPDSYLIIDSMQDQ